jgi:pimeloyl-ACP methyl ester carboxylesterase
MLEAFISFFNLRWTNQSCLGPLPEGITRDFIATSTHDKSLEILVAKPQSRPNKSNIDRPPILFLHGGFGSAALFIPFMTYFSKQYQSKHSTYALSMRGRGASYSLCYLNLVYGTSLSDLASDLAIAVEHITKLEGRAPIVLGHSSGGGLIQYALANRLFNQKIPGFVLLDAVPNFGNMAIYSNWARHDPWFILRMLLHCNHVASPLSSKQLVRGAFFGSDFARRDNSEGMAMTQDFMNIMAPYESLMWPLQMMKGFWAWLTGGKEKWLDTKEVLHGVDLTNTNHTSVHADRVCIIVGDEDVLMDTPGQKRMAGEYRQGIQQLIQEKKFDQDIHELMRPVCQLGEPLKVKEV